MLNFARLVYSMCSMKKIDINDMGGIEATAEALASGAVVMHPTETCYGLAVDISNELAVKKLYEVKKMDKCKPVSVLVDGIGMAEDYGIFSDLAHELVRQYWPGPLSIVVPRKKTVPVFLNPGHDFISIRYSSLAFCTDMVKKFGKAVTTTSANVSGEPQFYGPVPLVGVDLLVDAGDISKNQPSTIVKVDGDRLEILRQGSVELDHV